MLFNPVGSVIYTKQEGAVFIISQQDKIDMNVNRKKVSKGLRLNPLKATATLADHRKCPVLLFRRARINELMRSSFVFS